MEATSSFAYRNYAVVMVRARDWDLERVALGRVCRMGAVLYCRVVFSCFPKVV